MSDRFKFRGIHPVLAELQEINFIDFIHNTVDFGDGDIFKIEEVNMQQSTGKKDTNGKLIYEDDILELKAKNGMTFQYVVKFKDYCFILEYINGKLKGTKARNFAKQYVQPQRMYEHGYMVIGNIYENKDLLNA